MNTPFYKPWILGLTGGIGSGKSTAAEHFAALGIHVVDADRVARWLVESSRPILAKIAKHFSDEVLHPDGQLNREVLRSLIFSDPEQRCWLETLLHPLVREEIAANLAQIQSRYAILVSPLLFEHGQHTTTQRVLVIDAPQALQIQRTLARDNTSEKQVQAILMAQSNRQDRLRDADDVIVNDKDLTTLQAKVERLHHFYLTLCRD